MKAIIGERVGKNAGAGHDGGKSEEIFVGLDDDFGRNGANAPQQISVNGHAAGAEERAATPEEQRAGNGVGLKTKAIAGRFGDVGAVHLHIDDAVADDASGWIFGDGFGDAGKFLRLPPIVGIEEGDDVSFAVGDGVIEGAGLAAVGLAEDLDLRGKLGEDFRGAVGGTVVDNDNFAEIGWIILGEDAVQGLFDETFVIVSVDENANERLWHADSNTSFSREG